MYCPLFSSAIRVECLSQCGVANAVEDSMLQSVYAYVQGEDFPDDIRYIPPKIPGTNGNYWTLMTTAEHREQGRASRYARLRRGFVPRPMAFASLLRFFA